MKHRYISFDKGQGFWKVSNARNGKEIRKFDSKKEAISYLEALKTVLTYELKEGLKWKMYVVQKRRTRRSPLKTDLYKLPPQQNKPAKPILVKEKVTKAPTPIKPRVVPQATKVVKPAQPSNVKLNKPNIRKIELSHQTTPNIVLDLPPKQSRWRIWLPRIGIFFVTIFWIAAIVLMILWLASVL